MKKKFLILTIVVALVVVFALVFSSCSAKKKIDDIINGGATDNGIYPSADYDTAQIEQKLNEMKGNGVYVKIRVTDDGEDEEFFAYGAKGEVYFFQYGDSDDQIWLDLSNNDSFVEYDCEESDTGALVWTKNVTHYNEYLTKETLKQTAEAYASTVWANLGFYANLTGEGTKTQITMLGRSCDKYVVRNGAATVGASVGWTIECVVDKATGVCLKYAISAEATTVDGHETASFAIEATEFNASWSPRLPQASRTVIDGEEQQGGGGETPGGGEQGGETPGGEGGQGGSGESGEQGEVPSDSAFVNKKLVVSEVECSNQEVGSMFTNARACLFSDSDFELISGMGVLFGTYRVMDNDRYVSLTAFKEFDFESQEYDHDIARSMQNLSIVKEQNGFRLDINVPVENYAMVPVTLYLRDSGAQPMRESLPNDPNGDAFNTQYQVEQSTWDYIFQDRLLLAGGKRFTVARTSDAPNTAAGTFKVDRNKIEDSWAQGHIFYDKTGNTPDDLGQYAYDEYRRESIDTWYSVPANYSYEHFDGNLGIVPVPFARLNYSSIGHYYYINLFRWTETGSTQEKEVQNYKVWFVDGNVQKIEYNTYGTTYTHTFNYSAYNTTTVELPEISGGQPQSANIDDCYDTLEDTVLAFNRVSNADDYAETYTQVMQGATIYIFDDHTFEMHVHKAYNTSTGQILDNMEFLYYGTFALTGTGVGNSTGKAYASGALTTTQFYVNGSLNQDYTPDPMDVMWYVADNELRVDMSFYGWFALTNDTPTRTPVPGGGGQGGEDPGTDPGTDPPADTHVYISTKYPAETQKEFAIRMMRDYVDEDGLEFAVSINNGSEETTFTFKLMFDDEKFVIYENQNGTEGITELLRDDEEYFYEYSFDGEEWSCDKVAYADAEGNQPDTIMSIMTDIFGMLWIADNYRDMEFDSVETRQGLDDRDGDCYELETDYYSLTIAVDQETGAKFLLLMQNSNGGLMLVQSVTSFKESTEIPAHEVEPARDEIEYIYQGYDAGMHSYIVEHYAIEDSVRKVYLYHLAADGEPEGAPFTLAEVQANESFGCTDMSEQNFAWSYDSEEDTIIVTRDGEPVFGVYIDEYDSQNGIGILGEHFNFIFEPDEPAWDEIEYFSQFMDEEEGQQYYIVEWFYKNGDNNLMRSCIWEVEDMPEGAPFTFAELESEREAHHQEWGDCIARWQYDEERNAVILLHDGEPTGEYYLIDGYDAESGKGILGKCLYEPQWNNIEYIQIIDSYEDEKYRYILNHYTFDEGDNRVIYSYDAAFDEELTDPLTLAYVQDENNGFDVENCTEQYGDSWYYDEDEFRVLYLYNGLAEGYFEIIRYDEEQGVGILDSWTALDYSGKEFFMQSYDSSEQILCIEYYTIDGDDHIVIQYLKEGVTEEPERLTLAEVQSDEGFVESNLTDVSGASWSYDPNGELMITVIYDENEPGDTTGHWGIFGYDIENDIVIVGNGL